MKINSCIKNLLKYILVLQNNSTKASCTIDDCSKPFLGPPVLNDCYNTRIITLYNMNGELFNGTYFDNAQLRTSSYFRIQKIDENCCTLLILNNVNNEYFSTRQTVTVNLNCICAIKCIEDVCIDL